MVSKYWSRMTYKIGDKKMTIVTLIDITMRAATVAATLSTLNLIDRFINKKPIRGRIETKILVVSVPVVIVTGCLLEFVYGV